MFTCSGCFRSYIPHFWSLSHYILTSSLITATRPCVIKIPVLQRTCRQMVYHYQENLDEGLPIQHMCLILPKCLNPPKHLILIPCLQISLWMEKKKQCINQIRDALATENYNECTSIKLKNLQRMPTTRDRIFNELKLLFTMVFQLIPLFSTYYKFLILLFYNREDFLVYWYICFMSFRFHQDYDRTWSYR